MELSSHRETFRRVLNFPASTKVEWKEHQESIQQRITIEESRRERANQQRSGNKQSQQNHQRQIQQGENDNKSAQTT